MQFNDFLNTIFFSSPTVALIVAIFLDNTLDYKDSARDRGMPWWVKFRTFKGDSRNEEFYTLPFNLNRFFPPSWMSALQERDVRKSHVCRKWLCDDHNLSERDWNGDLPCFDSERDGSFVLSFIYFFNFMYIWLGLFRFNPVKIIYLSTAFSWGPLYLQCYMYANNDSCYQHFPHNYMGGMKAQKAGRDAIDVDIKLYASQVSMWKLLHVRKRKKSGRARHWGFCVMKFELLYYQSQKQS